MIKKVNVQEKMALFNEHWTPKIVGDLNDSFIKVAKFHGEFIWHTHDDEDELFYVTKGELKILLRAQEINLKEGEFVVIPKGVEHKPVASEEVEVVLIELKSTLNTGDQDDDLTQSDLETI